jgi:hypothetical protein
VFANDPRRTSVAKESEPVSRVSADVHRYGFPRTDLSVTLDGVVIKPALALGAPIIIAPPCGWVAFKPAAQLDQTIGTKGQPNGGRNPSAAVGEDIGVPGTRYAGACLPCPLKRLRPLRISLTGECPLLAQSRHGLLQCTCLLLTQSGRNKKNIKTKTVVSPWGNLLALARCQYPRG